MDDECSIKHNSESGRRKFLKTSLLAGGATVAGAALFAAPEEGEPKTKKIKVLTTEGKVIEVDTWT